jgi:4-carboxymuconolactone decarboxylase
MTDDINELKEITRKTTDMLFGTRPRGDMPYAIWRRFDKDLAKQFSMFFGGRLYSREVLTQRERELCAVAALTVLDRHRELKMHIDASKEVAEVIFQMAAYGGMPTMVEGMFALKEVLEERGMWEEE